MSKVVLDDQPCPCGKSSDAYHVYDDGHGFCFSCNQSFNNKNREPFMDDKVSYQYLADRGITEETMRFFKCLTRVDANGKPEKIAFPYGDSGQKVRIIGRKEFYSEGNMKDAPLFGQSLFTPGQSKAVTITEGEYDALSVFQMLGSKYPTVSIRGASTARKDCENSRDFLNSFEKIYLCFDNDPPGQEAIREVALLFDTNKICHVKLGGFKDANDYLQNGKEKEFVNAWYNARPYMPKDIIATWDEVDRLLAEKETPTIGSYPFTTLETMCYGIRSAECILFKAQEKVGKTEVLRAIEYHLLKTTDLNIGIIHLEEKEKRSVQGLVGYDLRVPVHLPDAGVSSADVSRSFRELTRTDGRCHFYQHFGSDDPEVILDVIRYLVTVRKCKVIFLDHITMLVTDQEEGDERRKLDYISTRLAMMTRELDFTLMLVSHVNDDGKTRGSRNISKVADIIINLHREIEAPVFDERNKTYISIQGNRFAGLTGPAGVLWFDPKSFTLEEMKVADVQGSSLRDFEARPEESLAVRSSRLPF